MITLAMWDLLSRMAYGAMPRCAFFALPSFPASQHVSIFRRELVPALAMCLHGILRIPCWFITQTILFRIAHLALFIAAIFPDVRIFRGSFMPVGAKLLEGRSAVQHVPLMRLRFKMVGINAQRLVTCVV
jgi:hypothetical protein